MSHPPQEGSNRNLQLWTLLSVLWQICHVWITAWSVNGSVLLTGRPSYLKQKSTIFLVFRGVVSWLFYHAWNIIWTSSRVILTKPDYITCGTCDQVMLDGRRTCATYEHVHNVQTCINRSLTYGTLLGVLW